MQFGTKGGFGTRAARLLAVAAISTLLPLSGAQAQGALTLELGFSNPGARSLGFGGAFVALADDATAAYANPAGLVQVTVPEVSVEVRHWSFTTPYLVGGRASGDPTGLGIDTVAGLRYGESTADFTGLSFFSYVHPLGRWTLAAYRHQWARFASAYETDGLFAEGSTHLDTDRWLDRPGSTDMAVVGWNLTAARRVTESLSLGLGLTWFEVDAELETTAYLPDDDSVEAFFSANSFLPERSVGRTSTTSQDSAVGIVAGLLWKITDQWSLGGSLHSNFSVDAHYKGVPGPAAEPNAFYDWDFTGGWNFPAALGLGAAWRSPGGRWTGSFEWDRIFYSGILEGDTDEAIPDGDELHLGGEYAFLRMSPIVALRAGLWIDPDHRIRATAGDELFRAVLAPGEDVLHYAGGVGVAFSTFQLDLAVDVSKLRDTLSLSMIYSF